MTTYTTVQGDMWDSIAYAQLGSESYTGRLMALNPQYRDYVTFPAGVVLALPDAVESTPTNLPPWRQTAG